MNNVHKSSSSRPKVSAAVVDNRQPTHTSVDPAGQLMLALQLSFSTIEDLKLHFAAAAEANNLLFVRKQAVASMRTAAGGGSDDDEEAEAHSPLGSGEEERTSTNEHDAEKRREALIKKASSASFGNFRSSSNLTRRASDSDEHAATMAAINLERFERAVQDESAVLGSLAGGSNPSEELVAYRQVVKNAAVNRRKSSISNPLLLESSARRLSQRRSTIGLPAEVAAISAPSGGGGPAALTAAQKKLRLQMQHGALPYPMRSLHFIDEDSFAACVLDYFEVVREALEEHILLEGQRNRDDRSDVDSDEESAGHRRKTVNAAKIFFGEQQKGEDLPTTPSALTPTSRSRRKHKSEPESQIAPLQPKLLSADELRELRLQRIQRRRQRRLSNAEAAAGNTASSHHVGPKAQLKPKAGLIAPVARGQGQTYDPFMALEAARSITESSVRLLFSALDCGDRGVVSWAELTAFCLDGAMLAKNHGEKADALSEWTLEPNPLRAEVAGGLALQRPVSIKPMHGVDTILILDRRHGLLTVDPSQETAKSINVTAGLSAPVLAFEYVSDEDCFVVSTMAGEIAVFDPRENGTLEKISAGIGPVTVIRYHSVLKRLFLGGREGRVAVYQIERSKWHRVLPLKFISRLCCHNTLFQGVPSEDGLMMETLMSAGGQVGLAPDRDLSMAASKIISDAVAHAARDRRGSLTYDPTGGTPTEPSSPRTKSPPAQKGRNTATPPSNAQREQPAAGAASGTSPASKRTQDDTGGVVDICYHRTTGVIVIGYDDCLVQVIVPSGRTDIRSFYATGGTLCSVAICEDQGAIVVGTSDKKPLEVWSLSTGEGQVKPYYLDSRNARHESPVIGIVTMPHNAQCFSLDFLGLLKVWDMRTFSPLQSFHLEVRDPRHGWSSLTLSGGGAIYCCDRQSVTTFRRKEDTAASIHTLTTSSSASKQAKANTASSNKPDVPQQQNMGTGGEGSPNADGTTSTKARNRRAILDRQAAIENADVVTAAIFASVSPATNQLLLCTTRLLKILTPTGALVAEIDLSAAAGAAVMTGFALSERTHQAAREEIQAARANRFRSKIRTSSSAFSKASVVLATMYQYRQEITSAVMDASGKRLFCGLASGAVVVVNTSTGGIVAAYPAAHACPVASIVFARHLNCAISCGADGSGSFLYTLGIDTAADYAITLSPSAVSNFSEADSRLMAQQSQINNSNTPSSTAVGPVAGGSSTSTAARVLSPASLLTQTPIPAFRCQDGCSMRYIGPPVYILLACSSEGHVSGYDCRVFDFTGASSVTPLFTVTVPLGVSLKGLSAPKGYINLLAGTVSAPQAQHASKAGVSEADRVLSGPLQRIFLPNIQASQSGVGSFTSTTTQARPLLTTAPFPSASPQHQAEELIASAMDAASTTPRDDLDGFLLSTIDRNNNNQSPGREAGVDEEKQQFFGRPVVGHAYFHRYDATFVFDSRRITLLRVNRLQRQGVMHGQWMFELFESNEEAARFKDKMRLPHQERLKYLEDMAERDASDGEQAAVDVDAAAAASITNNHKARRSKKSRSHLRKDVIAKRLSQLRAGISDGQSQRKGSPTTDKHHRNDKPTVFARGFSRPKVDMDDGTPLSSPSPRRRASSPAISHRAEGDSSNNPTDSILQTTVAPQNDGDESRHNDSGVGGDSSPLAAIATIPSISFQSTPSPKRQLVTSARKTSFLRRSKTNADGEAEMDAKKKPKLSEAVRRRRKLKAEANPTIEQRLLGRLECNAIQSNDPVITFIQFDEQREEIYVVADLNFITVIDVSATLKSLKQQSSGVSPPRGGGGVAPPRWVSRIKMPNPIVSLECVDGSRFAAATATATGADRLSGIPESTYIGSAAAHIFGIAANTPTSRASTTHKKNDFLAAESGNDSVKLLLSPRSDGDAITHRRLLVGYMDGYVDMLDCDQSLKTVWSGLAVWAAHPVALFPQEDVRRSNRIQELTINVESGMHQLAEYQKRVLVEQLQETDSNSINAAIGNIPPPPYTQAEIDAFKCEIKQLTAETTGIPLHTTIELSADLVPAVLPALAEIEDPRLLQELGDMSSLLTEAGAVATASAKTKHGGTPTGSGSPLSVTRKRGNSLRDNPLNSSFSLGRAPTPRPTSTPLAANEGATTLADYDAIASGSFTGSRRDSSGGGGFTSRGILTSGLETARREAAQLQERQRQQQNNLAYSVTKLDLKLLKNALLRLFNAAVAPFTSITFAPHLMGSGDDDNSRNTIRRIATSTAPTQPNRRGAPALPAEATVMASGNTREKPSPKPPLASSPSAAVPSSNIFDTAETNARAFTDDNSIMAVEGEEAAETLATIVEIQNPSEKIDGGDVDLLWGALFTGDADGEVSDSAVVVDDAHVTSPLRRGRSHNNFNTPTTTKHDTSRTLPNATTAEATLLNSHMQKQEWVRQQLDTLSRKRTKNKAVEGLNDGDDLPLNHGLRSSPTFSPTDFESLEQEKKRRGIVPVFRTKGRAIPVFYQEDPNAACVAVEELEALNGQMRVEKIDRIRRRLARRLKRARQRETATLQAINLSASPASGNRGVMTIAPPPSMTTSTMSHQQMQSIEEVLGHMRMTAINDDDGDTSGTDDSSLGGALNTEGGGSGPSAFEVELQLEKTLMSQPPGNPRLAVKRLEQLDRMKREALGTRQWAKFSDSQKAAREERALRALVAEEDYKVYVQRAGGRVQDPRETTLSKKADALAEHLKRQQIELEDMADKASNAYKIGGNRYVELPEDIQERRLKRAEEIAENGFDEVTILVSPQKGRQVSRKEKRFAITLEKGKMVAKSTSSLLDPRSGGGQGDTTTMKSPKLEAPFNNTESSSNLARRTNNVNKQAWEAQEMAFLEEKLLFSEPTDPDFKRRLDTLHDERIKAAVTPLMVAQARQQRDLLHKKREAFLRRPLLQQPKASTSKNISKRRQYRDEEASAKPPTPTEVANIIMQAEGNNNPAIYLGFSPDPDVEDLNRSAMVPPPSSIGVLDVSEVSLPPVQSQRHRQGNDRYISQTPPPTALPPQESAYNVALRAGTPSQPTSRARGATSPAIRHNQHLLAKIPRHQTAAIHRQSRTRNRLPPSAPLEMLHCRGVPPEVINPSLALRGEMDRARPPSGPG